MPELAVLSLAVAAACMAGLNVYLTAFMAGLAGRLGWIPLEQSGLLSEPAVMTVMGVLWAMEAAMDKVPVVDSLWDALHTVIRPAGAVILALYLAAGTEPGFRVMAGTIAGVAGFTIHFARTALRLHINNAPGPLPNVMASLAGDALAAGVLILAMLWPVAGLAVSAVLFAAAVIAFPWLFRAARAGLYFLWKKLRMPPGMLSARVKLFPDITTQQQLLLLTQLTTPGNVQWAVPCVTGRTRHIRGLGRHMFGTLISVKEHPELLVFIGRRWSRDRAVSLHLTGCTVQHTSGFLSENVAISHPSGKRLAEFRLGRADEALAARLEEVLHFQLRQTEEIPAASPVVEAPPAPAGSPSGPFAEMLPLPLPPVIIAEAPAACFQPVMPELNAPFTQVISPFPEDVASSPAPGPAPSLPATADVPPMPVFFAAEPAGGAAR